MRALTGMLPFVLVPFLFSCGGPGGPRQEKVLAKVNGATITEGDFRREAELLPLYMRPILETPNGRKQFLESLVTRDLLLQEALRRGVDRMPEVRRRLEQARRSVVIEALLRDVGEKAPGLSDEALRKHYEENAANFEVGERVRVRQILFPARERAEAAAKRAKEGEPFERLMDEAQAMGGKASDLGLVERGETDKEFEKAAFGAPLNTVVGPVKTPYGFHLLRVDERRPAGRMPFEEVREEIAAEVRETAQREAFERLVAELRGRSRVTLLDLPGEAALPADRVPAEGAGGAPPEEESPGDVPPARGR